jgi:protein SCO1
MTCGNGIKASMYTRLLLLIAALALLVACGPYRFRSGTLLEPADPAPAVALTDTQGAPFRLSEQRGALTLLFFGFTNCPDVCPTTLADLAAARKQLGDDAERVKVVLVTVDPERDTPERLGRYVQSFDPSFIGLTGPQADLEQIYQSYGVSVTKRQLPDSALGYTVDHGASVYVVDQSGNWRALISNGSPVADIVADLRYLLRS